ncbi:hypothetical protein RND81_12G021400 [Saponaria officinalis]|uniref:Uncharacterized protein n=1 Tax=Saponaria officinalis TaxID=3572 RepID=A0AAW1H4Z2_SAPOF
MDQLDFRQQQKNNKPMLDVIEPSLVRAHFASKKDVSFSSYLKPHNKNDNDIDNDSKNNNKIEEVDQISIFDAAKYFSGIHDNNKQSEQCNNTKEVDMPPIAPRLSSVSSSIETSSNYGGGRNSHGSYRTRSFHATPTASSEASWNSQTGLLANPPGSVGISIVKSFSNNSSNGSRGTNNNSVKWPRLSTKWLNKGRKCPCLGKKSVQVEERIDSKTLPRMVDLRQGTNHTSNGSISSISSTLYSPRQNSPKNLETIVSSSTTTLLRPLPNDSKSSNFNLVAKNPIDKNGYPYNSSSNSGSSLGLNSKVVGPLKLYDDLAKVGGVTSSTNNVVVTTTSATTTVGTAAATATSNGFTFPILENPPIGVKKMFNVTPNNHNNYHNSDEPHRDSLEVFQPRSHPSPNKSRRTSYEDENVSDGSSDLFEIDSFSTSTYPYRDSMDEVIVHSSNFGTSMKRLGIICPSYNNNNNNNNNNNQVKSHNNNIDEIGICDIDEEPMTPSVAPTDCYAPSEVSVDWSVTTAEGFDRGSLSNFSASASDFAYAAMRREAEQYRSVGGGGGGGGGGGEGKRWHNDNIKGNGRSSGGGGGGLLLGCRNERAISVGPSPIKCATQEGPQVGGRHVSGGPQVVRVAHVNGNGNMGRSRSTLLPMPFAT